MSLDNLLSPPAEGASTRHPDTARWLRALLIAATLLAWGFLLFAIFLLAGHLIQTLIMLAIAVLVAYGLAPFVNRLNRYMPRWAAIVITYLFFGVALAAIAYVIAGAVSSQIAGLSKFIQQQTAPGNSGGLQSLLGRLGISASSLQNLRQSIFSSLSGAVMNIFSIITGVADVVVGVIVVIVLSVYFSAHGPHVRRWIRQSAPLSQRDRVNYFLDTLDHVVGGYIRGQVTLSAIVGLLVFFGMFFLFHLPFAVLLGLLAFVLEFVPFLGVIISGAACVLVALTQGFFVALLVLGYFAIIHLIEAEIVGPRIVGRAIGLHPAVSLIALIAGAELFGIWGVLFANPIAGVIQSLAQTFWYEYRRTHPSEFPREAREGPPAIEREGGEWHRRPPSFKGVFFRWRRPIHP